MTGEALRVGPLALTEALHENELVDRYLNVNEISYEVASLWSLLERNGFKFLRWAEPAEWTLPTRGATGSDLAAHLTDLQRYQLVEQLSWRPQLFLIAGTEANGPRQIPPREQWASTSFALNPEVSIETETRGLRGSQRVERLTYKLRARPPVPLGGLMASVLLAIKDQTAPFKGKRLIEQLRDVGIDSDHALAVIAELLAREIVFVPHPTEL